jgi:hypothetical protein
MVSVVVDAEDGVRERRPAGAMIFVGCRTPNVERKRVVRGQGSL